jgi:hypothetical protein
VKHKSIGLAIAFLKMRSGAAFSQLLFFSLIAPVYAPPSAIQHAERANLDDSTTIIVISPTQPSTTPLPTNNNGCINPCGYYGQLCCAVGETCYTDANNQAQCGPPPASTTCPLWSTSTYTAITTQFTSSTYVVTYTRIRTDIQTIVGTASWQVFPQPSGCCAPATPPECFEIGATPCGDICCSPGSTCGSDGTCQQIPATCSYALGETPCGNICCASGEYCAAVGLCVAVPTTTGYWSYYTTTYVETDLQTVTTVFSSFVGGDYTVTAPLRPTVDTVVTVTAPYRPTTESVIVVTSTGVCDQPRKTMV